jgi:D-sedoheptulose 7-phosphate isomerase
MSAGQQATGQFLDQTLDQAAGQARVAAALEEAADALAALRSDSGMLARIAQAGALLARALGKGSRVFSCGNGGSLCDAMHFAEELSGRFRADRPAYAATAIADAGHLSCVANDYGYEQVFARYLQAHARPGDVLLAISTSGRSGNVLAAARTARAQGVHVIGLMGRPGAELEALCDIAVCTPGGRWADRVQELHIKVIHILIELVEQHLAGPARTGA